MKSQKLVIFWNFEPGRRGTPAVEEDVKEKHPPQLKTPCFQAFILSLPSGFLPDERLWHSGSKLKWERSTFFSVSLDKVLNWGIVKHAGMMDVRAETSSSIAIRAAKQTPPRAALLCGWPCAAPGSDLGSELIMEPNSCCYGPINKNQFYSRFFFLPTPHHRPSCPIFKPRGLVLSFYAWKRADRLNIYCWNSGGSSITYKIQQTHPQQPTRRAHAASMLTLCLNSCC